MGAHCARPRRAERGVSESSLFQLKPKWRSRAVKSVLCFAAFTIRLALSAVTEPLKRSRFLALGCLDWTEPSRHRRFGKWLRILGSTCHGQRCGNRGVVELGPTPPLTPRGPRAPPSLSGEHVLCSSSSSGNRYRRAKDSLPLLATKTSPGGDEWARSRNSQAFGPPPSSNIMRVRAATSHRPGRDGQRDSR